jgi:short-subunit dehydrogenase
LGRARILCVMARRVLVTGATSGIGQATVRRLDEKGFEVWGTARDPEDLEALGALGVRPVRLDLENADSIASAVREVDPARELHGLVHNAGVGVPGAIEDLGPDAWRRQFDVNVFGPVELTRRLVPALRKADGRVVLVSSQATLAPVPYYGAYRASKAALEAIGDALRFELDDVDATIVQPGVADTSFQATARSLLDEHVDMEASRHGEAYEDVDAMIDDALPSVEMDAIVDAIEEALIASSPKTRKPVGRASWLGAKLLGLLPARVQDRVLRWMF